MNYDPHSARELLSRAPAVLRAMLDGLPPEWLDAPEKPGAWSPRDVACHVADLEHDGWLPRVRAILDAGTNAPLPGVDRERFRTRYQDVPLDRVLDDFALMRARNLDALDQLQLDAATLDTAGRHPTFGKVTLAQLLSTWVVHDLTHQAQIARTLAAQYRGAVGPWTAFLSILGDRT